MKNYKISDFPNSGNVQEVQTSYKKRPSSELTKIKSSQDLEVILRSVWTDKIDYIEEVVLIGLSRSSEVLGWAKVSAGGTAGTVMDAKIIFQILLSMNASAFVVSHNHPSGNPEPSQADIKVTRQLREGGKILEITMLDHIIITSESYYSFADDCNLI